MFKRQLYIDAVFMFEFRSGVLIFGEEMGVRRAAEKGCRQCVWNG